MARKVERLLLALPCIPEALGLCDRILLRGLLNRLSVLVELHYGATPRGHPDIIRYEFLTPVHGVKSLAFPTRLWQRVPAIG
jgi:hypothetical protein